ncbi:heparinase II/III family protein [Microbacterium sp. CFBP 13617]|uniref:heparinase II/III domain-containing protein n=1 Tax=Microbacterium sp. CFBP 13617 TaxID=2774035 RepID=UPI0017877475|nr:heparinase II/III family protein [Microbacterium sp. CFBP 13617]MBD8217826.1 heparinase II/III family protein [Microbacterium sp. CFBP 13617]
MPFPTAAFRGPLATLVEGITLRAPAQALPVPPASDRAVWDPRAGSADRIGIDDLVARAGGERATPWPQPRASDAARVHRDGDRTAWEDAAFERQRRLSRAAVAAASTLDEMWIDEVVDGVVLLCEQSSWCWPAHDDTRSVHGSVLATVTDPFVDLGAGEVVAQLAWIDHLLGEQLDARAPGLRARIRHEARTRVFAPFQRRRDWHWIGLDGDVHNWNPWIHGNVIVAALRLLDRPDEAIERDRIVALAVEGLDRYVAVLPADGAIDEGYAYWWNGAARALEALDVLAHATDGAVDTTAVTALRETVAFPHRSHLGGDWFVNHADGQARPPADQPWHALHRAARRHGDTAAAALAASHRRPGTPAATEREGLGRLLRGLTDPAWVSASPAPPPLPRDVWLPSTQVFLARERAGSSDGLTLVAKGGHNGEHHNHNDVGAVVIAVDGVPVLVDAGRPTYTAATFGPDRYDIWTMQSAWHNVPVVRGVTQPAGADAVARDAHAEATDDLAVFRVDLADAYPDAGLASWRRRAALDRTRGRIEIDDAWRFADDAPTTDDTRVHLLVAGEVTLERGGARVVPIEGARAVRLRWPSDIEATAEVRELDDPLLTEVWGERLTRLALPLASRTHVQLTVELDTPTEDLR